MPRLLSRTQLKTEKGIGFSPQWLCELVGRGLFPMPIKIGEGKTGVNAWLEEEIDKWIAARAAARHQPEVKREEGHANGTSTA
jgi:predicted DNA-binding transcriptional regulator AlpA